MTEKPGRHRLRSMLALGGSPNSSSSSMPATATPAAGDRGESAPTGREASNAQGNRCTAALPRLDPTDGQQGADAHRTLLWTLTLIGLASIALAIGFVLVNGTRPTTPSTAPAPRVLRPSRDATREAQQSKITELQDDLERVELELAQAQATIDAREMAVQAGAVSLNRSPLALILDVPPLKQEHSLSCESSVAAMAAQYHGVPASESAILQELPLHENPHLGFRGNVDGLYGGLEDYGVYAEPIRQVLAGWGLQTERLEGGIEEIKQQIRQGRPVIAWVTYRLQVQTPTQMLLAGPTGERATVTMVAYEHAILIVGYNQQGLWINDPYDGTRTFVSADEFRRSFAYLGDMALVVGPPAS